MVKMEKDYPAADQCPLTQPTDDAYLPAVNPLSAEQLALPPYPTNQYPALDPDAYPTQPQLPPDPASDPGVVQQQQANAVVIATVLQQATNVARTNVKPRNYKFLSLLNLFLCCPLGIVALIYSLKVDSEFAAGRYEKARRASNLAKRINYAGIAASMSLIVGYTITILVILLIYVVHAVETHYSS